jgi:hypothetical protein
MTRSGVVAVAVFACAFLPGPLSADTAQAPEVKPAQDPAVKTAQEVVVRDVVVNGARELSPEVVLDSAGVGRGRPLPVPVERVSELADRVLHRYKDDGFTFATVTASFDAGTETLSFTINEGVIDDVEFTGVDDRLKRMFAEQFALRAGDVFNRKRARQALDVLLEQTRGAVRPGKIFERSGTFYDSRQLGGRSQRGTFDLVDKNGGRVLMVGLYEAAGRFKVVPDLGEREDWFTSVNGFVPSLGMGAAIFDHDKFNHSYLAGHLSIATATGRVGYALGFERPYLSTRKLYAGGEFYDLTASDDLWQSSSLEASLAAIGPRVSTRDYYRRRGVQVNAAFRPWAQFEILGAWRGEHHYALPVESDFSFWNGDDEFRTNQPIVEGHLGALVLGASVDGDGFARESLDATYRRHQLESLFGEPLPTRTRSSDFAPVWRVDWTSEISAPDAFGSDYDFTRSIVNARVRKALTKHQDVGARFIQGWSSGTAPPQRLFSIGGIGSLHGYDFKIATGTSMSLLNLEYMLGWRNGLQLLGFYDVGQVSTSPWLKGVGWGIGLAGFSVEFGYPTSDVRSSPLVLVRFGHSF